MLQWEKLRNTVLIFRTSDDVKEGRIQINKAARNNLQVKLGDLVNVHQCLNIQYCGKRVHIHPFGDSVEGLNGNIFDISLKPYFLDGKSLVSGGGRFSDFLSSIPTRSKR